MHAAAALPDALPSDAELLVALVAELQDRIRRQTATRREWAVITEQLRRTAQLLEASLKPRRHPSTGMLPVIGEGRFAKGKAVQMTLDRAADTGPLPEIARVDTDRECVC